MQHVEILNCLYAHTIHVVHTYEDISLTQNLSKCKLVSNGLMQLRNRIEFIMPHLTNIMEMLFMSSHIWLFIRKAILGEKTTSKKKKKHLSDIF